MFAGGWSQSVAVDFWRHTGWSISDRPAEKSTKYDQNLTFFKIFPKSRTFSMKIRQFHRKILSEFRPKSRFVTTTVEVGAVDYWQLTVNTENNQSSSEISQKLVSNPPLPLSLPARRLTHTYVQTIYVTIFMWSEF